MPDKTPQEVLNPDGTPIFGGGHYEHGNDYLHYNGDKCATPTQPPDKHQRTIANIIAEGRYKSALNGYSETDDIVEDVAAIEAIIARTNRESRIDECKLALDKKIGVRQPDTGERYEAVSTLYFKRRLEALESHQNA